MKITVLGCLTVCLASCTTNAPSDRRAAGLDQTIIYAYSNGGQTCYQRVLHNYPLDLICVDGDDVRYSVSPNMSNSNFKPMPRHVEALFSSIPVERVLRHRQSVAVRNAGNISVDRIDSARQFNNRDLVAVPPQ